MRINTIFRKHSGAVGLLSVILVTMLVLVFMLTISLQVMLNIKNARLHQDFSTIYYVTEGALRDARMQLKKEETFSRTFLDISLNNVDVTRAMTATLSLQDVSATGTDNLISRVFRSTCETYMDGCVTAEQAP
ncbi:MAG: hypothetical protein A3B31_01340 [Candidatus Komeilibacteria bacterium RIFCSPLOWO2_01_FULL_53_11]|uniref:Uncharacterized protein n=1 Tax=Candidatus Komeilibacteria bacterium RIFCSPLOWO2_01_FULL_53_11 TaxID=1798552 RepID=A0A1G2BRE4_9BACT|nr:MAG: hypothetical protein A3B31_01340 [Candidatus Komeilibacteria bacterium RIFCSPLOWO2_01_FULL_53_11]